MQIHPCAWKDTHLSPNTLLTSLFFTFSDIFYFYIVRHININIMVLDVYDVSPESTFHVVCTQMSSDRLSPRVAWKSRFPGEEQAVNIYPHTRKPEKSEDLVVTPPPTHLPNPETGIPSLTLPDDTINHRVINHQVSAFKSFLEPTHVSPVSLPLAHAKLSSLVNLYLPVSSSGPLSPKATFHREAKMNFFKILFIKKIFF